MHTTDISKVLYGSDDTQSIVAVKALDSEVIIYSRNDDRTVETREPFRPWLITSSNSLEQGLELGDCDITELEGNALDRLVVFSSRHSYQRAKKLLQDADSQMIAFTSPEKQYLMESGKTLFKGMSFDNLRRMQLDLETTPYGADNPYAKIIMIGLSDNTGWECVVEGEETDILRQLVDIIQRRDPDVIEGHNIFGFDIPYLAKRAEKAGYPLLLGRDNTPLAFGQRKNCPIGGYSKPFTPAYISGRHIIDTLLAVQRYDVTKGRLERYGLKEVAKVFGFAESERVLIPGNEIADKYMEDPELVRMYNLQDVRETRSLANLVCQTEYYVTGMVPENYETVSVTGNGEKINSILVREYIRQGMAIPMPMSAQEVPGGYTDILATGVLKHIVKCDVESLYPSLMLSLNIKPSSDVLDIFVPALRDLTNRRIDAKNRAKTAADLNSHEYWDGIQASYKILINSFYGYLGGPFHFNDYNAAQIITKTGQETVKGIANTITDQGGIVIEIDTDGVYFQAPDNVASLEDEEDFINRIGDTLPAGIRLAHDGRYKAMISLKVKNYALITYDGEKIFKGAALRSRADEAFGKRFISQAIDLILQDNYEGIRNLYLDLAKTILDGKLPLADFTRRERITGKTFTSSQKKRSAAAAEGMQVGEFIEVYEKQDGTLGLAENYADDVNTSKLLDKLYRFAARLKPAFDRDFDALIDKPAVIIKRCKSMSSGQGSLELFQV